MTDRLYLDDPDLVDFRARVVATRTLADRAAVVLDRSAFYPEGGGQPADHGRLGGVPVVDVREEDGVILHLLGEPAGGPAGGPAAGLAVGDEVDGRVDAARRRDHLQQHHGQHLLSAAFEALLGAATTSFHLGADGCTIDLAIPAARLDAATLRAAEARANDLVFRDLPVTARDFSPEELAALPLRKDAVKGSRVVVVGELAAVGSGGVIDASPCGGTHPRRTGAVGAIAVLSAQKWGAGARVEFACGGRVLRLVAERGDRLAQAAEALRCAPAEVAAAARRAAEDLSARRKESEKLAGALAEVEASRLAAACPAGPIRAVLTPPCGGAANWLRAVAQGLAGLGRTALLGAVEDGRGVLCFARAKLPPSSQGGPGPNMGELLREAVGLLGGKGGGSPELAQGGGPDGARLEAALDGAAARAG